MILQQALHKRHPFCRRDYYEHVVRVSKRAKCFVFDADASKLIGQFATECSDLVVKHRQFAIPPYDTTYIEYDGLALHRGLLGSEPEGWEDTRMGYLIHQKQMYVMSGEKVMGKRMIHPFLWPVFYYMGDRGETTLPKSHWPVMNYGDKDPTITKMAMILGKSLEILVRSQGRDLDTLRDDAALQLSTIMSEVYFENEAYWGGAKQHLSSDQAQRILKECYGDIKIVWAGLLWLQMVPKTVAFSPIPGGVRLYAGKRLATSEHHTVHIHLKGKKDIRHVYMKSAAKRQSPRRHDVRGHWRHRGGLAVGCSHEWPDMPNELGQYICLNCTRKRWRVKSFERGDETKGFVDKEYKLEL